MPAISCPVIIGVILPVIGFGVSPKMNTGPYRYSSMSGAYAAVINSQLYVTRQGFWFRNFFESQIFVAVIDQGLHLFTRFVWLSMYRFSEFIVVGSSCQFRGWFSCVD